MMFLMFIVEDYFFCLLVKLLSEFSERGEGRLAPGKTEYKCTPYMDCTTYDGAIHDLCMTSAKMGPSPRRSHFSPGAEKTGPSLAK